MTMNTSFKYENDPCSIVVESEYQISQYKESEYNDVAKIESHKHQCKENEYKDVLKVEQPNYAALQNEQQTQRCRDHTKISAITIQRCCWIFLFSAVIAICITLSIVSICVAVKENSRTDMINSTNRQTHDCDGRWDWEQQAKNVCYEAKGKKYGVIKLTQRGLLTGIKLEHVSGNLTCQVSIPRRTTLWGCAHIIANQHEPNVLTIVTDNDNRVVFPVNYKKKPFDVPGFNAYTSNVLVFTNLASPNFFNKGQELRIWYTDDLYSHTTHDNGGVHCVNVYAKF